MANFPLNIKLVKVCPICQTEYQQNLMQVLSENEAGMLTYVTCTHCQASLLTRFSTLPQGIVGNAILTDLKSHEVMSYADSDALSENDVLDIHQIIIKKDLMKYLRK